MALFLSEYLSIEWNSMRLSDWEPQKVTKTVHISMLNGGMVSCGVVSCGHFFSIPSLSPIFFGQKLSLNIFTIIWCIFCQIKWSFLSKLAHQNTGVPPKDQITTV